MTISLTWPQYPKRARNEGAWPGIGASSSATFHRKMNVWASHVLICISLVKEAYFMEQQSFCWIIIHGVVVNFQPASLTYRTGPLHSKPAASSGYCSIPMWM